MVNHLGLVGGLVDEIGIVEIINEQLVSRKALSCSPAPLSSLSSPSPHTPYTPPSP
ncbi:MAG: DUF4277 domain-containing protein [Symploca sp. SIO2C1]|nr:DUF4277 domain-containing protein [Symploca sp. SIO2C1]